MHPRNDQRTMGRFLAHRYADKSELGQQEIAEIVENRLANKKFQCPLTTLSEVIDTQNVSRIDLLKIDVEKSEFQVLRGETTRVAIPFNRGRHPYELIAFQFSHHVLYENGRIEHKGQYLNTERGVFPNYEFIRFLKKELECDDGSIFRYAMHENSTLVAIYRQLTEEESAPADRHELQCFIKSITTSTKDNSESWDGKRTMIDPLPWYTNQSPENSPRHRSKTGPLRIGRGRDLSSRRRENVRVQSHGLVPFLCHRDMLRPSCSSPQDRQQQRPYATARAHAAHPILHSAPGDTLIQEYFGREGNPVPRTSG